MNAQIAVQSLLSRFRATRARVFASAISPSAADTRPVQPAGEVENAPPSAERGPRPLAPAQGWQAGFDAFRRGETAPLDPDAADGWHWAENAAARRLPLD